MTPQESADAIKLLRRITKAAQEAYRYGHIDPKPKCICGICASCGAEGRQDCYPGCDIAEMRSAFEEANEFCFDLWCREQEEANAKEESTQ